MVEPIQQVLEIAGLDLTFPDFTISGLPGFEFNTLFKGETTVYEVTKPDFSFQVATEDTINTLFDGLQFTMTDEIYLYTFKISKPAFHDLTGWSILYADFLGRVNV